jgi:hypothetical protein
MDNANVFALENARKEGAQPLPGLGGSHCLHTLIIMSYAPESKVASEGGGAKITKKARIRIIYRGERKGHKGRKTVLPRIFHRRSQR